MSRCLLISICDDIVKLKKFPRYWAFVRGNHRSQRPVTRSYDLFFDLRLNKRLSKQSRCRWFETPSCSLWCHRKDLQLILSTRNLFQLPHCPPCNLFGLSHSWKSPVFAVTKHGIRWLRLMWLNQPNLRQTNLLLSMKWNFHRRLLLPSARDLCILPMKPYVCKGVHVTTWGLNNFENAGFNFIPESSRLQLINHQKKTSVQMNLTDTLSDMSKTFVNRITCNYKTLSVQWTLPWAPFTTFAVFPAGISNYTHYKVRDKIISKPKLQPLKFGTDNFIPHFTGYMIIYPCCDLSRSMLVKGAPGRETFPENSVSHSD